MLIKHTYAYCLCKFEAELYVTRLENLYTYRAVSIEIKLKMNETASITCYFTYFFLCRDFIKIIEYPVKQDLVEFSLRR